MKDHIRLMTRFGCIVALVCATAFLIGGAQAQSATGIIRVAPTGTDVPGCGSIAQPCRTPHYAVLASIQNGLFQGQILLAGGTYTQSPDEQLIKITVLGSNLRITGGYSTSNWSVSNPAANPTILDGQNSKRAILISVPENIAPTCSVTITNLSIQNGRAPATDPFGGGMVSDNCASVRVSNVSISNSQAVGSSNTGTSAAGAGGGIAVRGSTNTKAGLIISNVTLQNNQATGGNESGNTRGGLGNGGGLFAINSNVTATDVTVTSNSAKAGDAPGGSGNIGGQLADSLGGGINLTLCPSFTFNRVTVSNNTARGGNASGTGGYGVGGGIFIELSTGSITNSTIKGNSATGGNGSTGGGSEGGAMHATGSALTLTNVVVVNNSAVGGTGNTPGEVYGGGISTTSASQASSLTATNIIVAANQASGPGFVGGGGMALRGTAFNISHATLADNVLNSPSEGGQAVIFFVNGTSGTLRNSITSGHSGSNSFYATNGAAGVTLDRVLSNDTTTTLLAVDPNATATQQNGITGDPKFVSPGSPNYDYRIGSGSAAIDRAIGSTVTSDFEGQPRPIGAAADVGADEYQVGLTGTSGDTSISLTLTPPPGTTVTDYKVIYTKEAGANDAAQGASGFSAGTGTSISLTGLSQRKTYTVKILAFNGATQVAESTILTFTTGRFFANLPLVIN